MGKVTRKRYEAELKAKVALEATRRELTLAELSSKHGIHQTMIAAWKRQAIEGLASTFSGKAETIVATGEAVGLGLTLIGGHPERFRERCHHAEDPISVFP